jgi:hypothetical protein
MCHVIIVMYHAPSVMRYVSCYVSCVMCHVSVVMCQAVCSASLNLANRSSLGASLPKANMWMGTVVLGDSFALVGGYDYETIVDSIVEYDAKTGYWITWDTKLTKERYMIGAMEVELESFPGCK